MIATASENSQTATVRELSNSKRRKSQGCEGLRGEIEARDRIVFSREHFVFIGTVRPFFM